MEPLEGGVAARGPSAALLLAAQELARGEVHALPEDASAVVSVCDDVRSAVLFRSQSDPNFVRIGLFHVAPDAAKQEPEFVDLFAGGDASMEDAHVDTHWLLKWSPDGQFLVVSGRAPGKDDASEACLWVVAHPNWVDSSSEAGKPLLLQVKPSEYLSAKYWTSTASIVSLFFQTSTGSTLFALSDDGVWLKMSVQLAKLTLVAMNQSATDKHKGLLAFSVVKRLNEWHAGVMAAAFEPSNKLLVVTGGLKDPSADLMEKQASSLSVWKVADADNKDVAELLDYTMVLKGKRTQEDAVGSEAEATAETKNDPVAAEDTSEDSGGLLTSVKSSLFAPLKMMVGAETTDSQVLQGSVSQLALSPDGNSVAMLDGAGRLAVRQVDACADVLKWTSVESIVDVAPELANCSVEGVSWLTSDLMALMLTNKCIIYTRLAGHEDESEVTAKEEDASEDEHGASTDGFGRLHLAQVQVYRPRIPGSAVQSDDMQTLAFAIGPSNARAEAHTLVACEVIVQDGVWVANLLRSVDTQTFVELLMEAERFDEALAVVALHATQSQGSSIDVDAIHRRIWLHFREGVVVLTDESEPVHDGLVFISTCPQHALQRGEKDAFTVALSHLRSIQDKSWVLEECLHLVVEDSSANMKKVFDVAWDALTGLDGPEEEAMAQKQESLQRYMYRLETLQMLLVEEEEARDDSESDSQVFDGEAFVLFRSNPVLLTAKQLAREGRVETLSVLLQRQAWNLFPHWLDVLELIPSCVLPTRYASLLPAIAVQVEDDRQFYTLKNLEDSPHSLDDDSVAEALVLLPENHLQDLTKDELSSFEAETHRSRDERAVEYAEWFTKRVMEMDAVYGQLSSAYELSRLAAKCLLGWTACEAKQPFDAFVLSAERLYKCVYPLHLSACCLLPLSEWTSLSIQEQALLVIGKDAQELENDGGAILQRLNTVFVSQRQDCMYALDELFAWLAQSILAEKPSLTTLALSALLIHQSNPSIALGDRWIQSDALLIKTALDVVYSVDITSVLGDKSRAGDEEEYLQRHSVLVEQLWTIFQSLPVRKDDDPPEIAQLQVAVDEMEDLMVTMDVLSRYGVVSCPGDLKYSMLATGGGIGAGSGASVGPHALLEQMCQSALSETTDSDDKDGITDGQWMEVLQDAMKLKQHAFGERLTQEMILDIILKHLLSTDSKYADAAQDLVDHWISSDVEAVNHVLDVLILSIQARLDTVTGYSEDVQTVASHAAATRCFNIARRLLELPVWNQGDRAASGAKQLYDELLALEIDNANACELLDLLTYGAVKLSPAKLRTTRFEDDVEERDKLRLETVCGVFTSNPSNYRPSARAREWLTQHRAPLNAKEKTEDEPLDAVMHLAKLLRVDAQKLEIYMKGAYAALYCMDYDVAYDLTMKVISGIPTGAQKVTGISSSYGGGSSEGVTLLHLVSLVLDLVSASSFSSWSKKATLCRTLLSASNASSEELFAHHVTDLVLTWLEKIEAVQALMIELGLSDSDVEQRRLAAGKKAAGSVEDILLNELEVVIDLLREEKDDRRFLLRLLQRGFQLVQVMTNADVIEEPRGESERMRTFLQQMIPICVQEAVMLASSSSSQELEHSERVLDTESVWQQYLELAFSYVLLWSDLSMDEAFETFCQSEILPLLFTEPPQTEQTVPSSQAVVRHFHHFFLFLAAQAVAPTEENSGSQSECSGLAPRRERLQALSSSYEAARRFGSSAMKSEEDELVSGMSVDGEGIGSDLSKPPQLLVSTQRYQTYLQMAKQCQARLASQKQSQELEHMSTFFNSELDLERFASDATYREEKILQLATRKERFQVARQFASKYQLDEYVCVLAYIKHALLSPTSSSSSLSRHDQLDQAFRSEDVDFLEEALQRPAAFGDFLLKPEDRGGHSVYELLDGTDHVGLLLVLRMVLECSKRIHQSTEMTPSRETSLFPLSKPSSDRVTLLFMCLKKLKDIAESLGPDAESVDLKLVSAATTTPELLTPMSSHTDTLAAKRQTAVEAARPLLSGKTVKLVTKVLRKLHRVSASSMVFIYLNDLLSGIWSEHGDAVALSADLAAYAYESCVPCLSVLSNEHLLLFLHLFLDGSNHKPLPELVAHLDLAEEFYGQRLTGLTRFGALLTREKRLELVADVLALFHTKYNSWQTSGPRSNVSSASSTSSSASTSWDPSQFQRKELELRYLERELAESACWLLLSEAEHHAVLSDTEQSESQSLAPLQTALRTWFATDALQQASSREDVLQKLLEGLCQRVTSVELVTLIIELILRSSAGVKASNEEVVVAITQSYQTAVATLVQQQLDGEYDRDWTRTKQWTQRLVWMWTTDMTDVASVGDAVKTSPEAVELGRHLRCLLSGTTDKEAAAKAADVLQRVVTLLAQSPSSLLKEVAARHSGSLELQTAVRSSVWTQCERVISHYEDSHEWTKSAVLSHVLSSASRGLEGANGSAEAATWRFGLHVKAVWAALMTVHRLNASMESFPSVLDVPSREILGHFDVLFEELLSFVESFAASKHTDAAKALRFSEQATVALCNLLLQRDEAQGVKSRGIAAWQEEQVRAVQTRVCAQFQVAATLEDAGNQSVLQSEAGNEACWAALFSRGCWGDRLLHWYTSLSYSKLQDERVVEAVALAHWEAQQPAVATQLLLLSPFDGLRATHATRVLDSVRQLARSASCWPHVMELALLRFDVCQLQQSGLHDAVTAFVLSQRKRKESMKIWTSSGDYVVCALVERRQFAAAGRLACALRSSHALLWDLENARLLLSNFLRALAKATPDKTLPDQALGELRRQVYVQTASHFDSAIH